jgi:mannitol-specific phosphotransferase system IIBC component
MSQAQAEEKKGIGRKVQAFGSFLSSMIMPNIGAFIAWDLSPQSLSITVGSQIKTYHN